MRRSLKGFFFVFLWIFKCLWGVKRAQRIPGRDRLSTCCRVQKRLQSGTLPLCAPKTVNNADRLITSISRPLIKDVNYTEKWRRQSAAIVSVIFHYLWKSIEKATSGWCKLLLWEQCIPNGIISESFGECDKSENWSKFLPWATSSLDANEWCCSRSCRCYCRVLCIKLFNSNDIINHVSYFVLS